MYIFLKETKWIPGPPVWNIALLNVLICLKKENLLSWRKGTGHKDLGLSFSGQQVLTANSLTGWIPRCLAEGKKNWLYELGQSPFYNNYVNVKL